MARVFKEYLSSLGAGFDSGLSGFDVTMVVLLFLLHPPDAYSRKALEPAAYALKKKTHWSLLDSRKRGHLDPASRSGIPDTLL
jgi:hypothetical protein